MRTLKLQMQMSVDGFVGGPNGELDWMQWDWDDELKKYADDLTDSVDSILLGRKMTEGFISYWSSVITDANNPEFDFGKKMIDKQKVVFTKTLKKSEWANTVLAKGDIVQEVNELKKQPGKDIIVYGGANFVSSLIKNNLIDQLYLFVNPTAIGNGLSIFNDRTNLKLVKSIPFSCGIVLLNYKPQKNK